jgi:hypothetical protein
LQVINSSPGELTPVFVTYDGECFRALATHGYPEEYAAMRGSPILRRKACEPFPILRRPGLQYFRTATTDIRSSRQRASSGRTVASAVTSDA